MMYGYTKKKQASTLTHSRGLIFLHLMDGEKPYCGFPYPLTLTDFGMGKMRCKGCLGVKKQKEKVEAKKEKRRLRQEAMKDFAAYTATMF